MDYSYYSAGPQSFQYGGAGDGAQSRYSMRDSQVSAADADLFRGLNSIGSNFDAFSQFSPLTHLTASIQDESFSPRDESQSAKAQLREPPKSISPESTHGDSLQHSYGDGSRSQVRRISSGVEMMGDIPASQQPGRLSSEEKDQDNMPAQDRRKAQNRAAQRAFRERKERHVKDLETKLATLASTSSNLQTDNERLKRELAALSTQNEILRATHTSPRSPAISQASFQTRNFHVPSAVPVQTGPQSFSPTEFVVATGGEATLPLKFDAYPNKRGRMLLAGAAWDLIVRDSRIAEGKVDLEEVCRRLKGKAMCDGRGPAFREDELRQVLDECALGGDDLL